MHPKPFFGLKAVGFLMKQVDRFLNLLRGPVGRAVINDDDLQLVHRVILVDAADNRPMDPLLFIKARNNDRYARRKIRIDRHVTV